MRIALVGAAYPLRGGIAHYIGLLWKYLSRKHETFIITFSRQYPKLLFPGKSQEESGDPGIPVDSRRWIDSINPFNWIRTGFRLRRMNPDLIIFKYWMPFFAPCYGTIAAIAKWRRNTRAMFICDNIIPHERRPGDKLLTRFVFRFIDSYVVQSRAVEKDLKLWHKDPLTSFIPHPVYEIFGEEKSREDARTDLAKAYPELGFAGNDRVLLFFGYVRDYKGLDVLLDAMPKVIGRFPAAKLLIAGEYYGDEKKYREQAERLGITGNVCFHSSYVPNEEVAMLFSAADVLTLPYKSATQSGIIQIAYNFNRPVIATDVGGLGEVIVDGSTGFITAPDNPDAFAEAVLRFLELDLFESFRSNVMEEKRKYSWDYMAEGIEQLYLESLDVAGIKTDR